MMTRKSKTLLLTTLFTAIVFLSSCHSIYQLQIVAPTESSLDSFYLLWLDYKGGFVSVYPYHVGLFQTDMMGRGTVKGRLGYVSDFALVLDSEVDLYAIVPLSESDKGTIYPTNRLINASPSVLSTFDEDFFSNISNQTPDYALIREKWKSKYGKIVEEYGNSNRLIKFMKQ